MELFQFLSSPKYKKMLSPTTHTTRWQNEWSCLNDVTEHRTTIATWSKQNTGRRNEWSLSMTSSYARHWKTEANNSPSENCQREGALLLENWAINSTRYDVINSVQPCRQLAPNRLRFAMWRKRLNMSQDFSAVEIKSLN